MSADNYFFHPDADKPQPKFFRSSAQLESERGWKKVKEVFTTDEFGRFTPELSQITQASFMGAMTGMIYGGFLGSRKNYLEFMERNQATAFISHLDAKKKLQDSVTLGFAKYGFRFAWRLCYFATSYTSLVTVVSVYRGKSSVIEHTTAGAVTGAGYKMNMGLRGMTAGALVGGFLGSIAGVITWGILKATGKTMEEIRLYNHSWRSGRDDAIDAAIKTQVRGTDFSDSSNIMEDHDRRFHKSGIDLKMVTELLEKEKEEIKAEEVKKVVVAVKETPSADAAEPEKSK